MRKLIGKILCWLGFHKTFITSGDGWYFIACARCPKYWHEDGTFAGKFWE